MPDIHALAVRYKDAYRVSRATVLIGEVAKIIGVVLGLMILVAGIAVLPKQLMPYSLMGAMFTGGVVGLVFFILGTLVAGLGQLLMASLDTAVGVSPLLEKEDKAKVILPNETTRDRGRLKDGW